MSTEKSPSTLLRKLKRAYGTPQPVQRSPMEEFIFSFLTWEGSVQRAENALKRLIDSTLDLNELRVMRPEDLAALIGKTYPNVEERAERLHLALDDLYKREHAVSLDRIIAMSKRDGRKYIEDLDGMRPYIAARIALFALDAHAVPIDDRTLNLLIQEGVVAEGSTIDKVVGKLERNIKSSESVEAHLLMQQWAENEAGSLPTKSKKPPAKAPSTKTTKKKPSRRKTTAK